MRVFVEAKRQIEIANEQDYDENEKKINKEQEMGDRKSIETSFVS